MLTAASRCTRSRSNLTAGNNNYVWVLSENEAGSNVGENFNAVEEWRA